MGAAVLACSPGKINELYELRLRLFSTYALYSVRGKKEAKVGRTKKRPLTILPSVPRAPPAPSFPARCRRGWRLPATRSVTISCVPIPVIEHAWWASRRPRKTGRKDPAPEPLASPSGEKHKLCYLPGTVIFTVSRTGEGECDKNQRGKSVYYQVPGKSLGTS